jgi:hypothetical protein
MYYSKEYQNREETVYAIYRNDDSGYKKHVPDAESSGKVIAWLAEGNEFTIVHFPVPELATYKAQAIENMSNLSFTKRSAFLPQYKLENAGLSFEDAEGNWTGVYDKATCIKYNHTVEAFRTEFYRLQTGINAATTLDEVDAVVATENYPTSIID